MAVAGLSLLLAEVEAAVGASRPDSVDASVKAFRANAPPLEVIRAAARGVATHYDRASRAAPRSLAILGAAANLISVMQPRFHALPVLQVVSYVASEKKASTPAKPPLVVSGEVTHLGRSFLFAVRAGDVGEAESIFLGMGDEGWGPKMAARKSSPSPRSRANPPASKRSSPSSGRAMPQPRSLRASRSMPRDASSLHRGTTPRPPVGSCSPMRPGSSSLSAGRTNDCTRSSRPLSGSALPNPRPRWHRPLRRRARVRSYATSRANSTPASLGDRKSVV